MVADVAGKLSEMLRQFLPGGDARMKRQMILRRQLMICSLMTVFCLAGCQSNEESSKGTDPETDVQKTDQKPATVERKPDDPECIAKIEEIGGTVQKDESGHVIAVDFGDTFGAEVDFSLLQGVPSVERITNSGGPSTTDDDLKQFVTLEHLKVLDIKDSPITDAGVEQLKVLPRLEDINLQRTNITDVSLKTFQGFPALKRLRIVRTNVTDEGLVHLKGMTQLELLNLKDCIGVSDQGLAHLADLKRMRNLTVWGSQVTDEGLKHLAGLTNLKALGLDNTQVTDEGLQHLVKLTSLTELKMYETFITDAGLVALAGMTELSKLQVRGTGVQDAGLAHLKHLSKLKQLPSCGKSRSS